MSATLSWNLVFLTPHARAALCGPGKSLLPRNARARARVSGFKVRSSYQQLPSELGERFVSNLQGLIYTVADAAVSSSASSTDQVVQAQKGDWLSGLTNALETVLKVLKDILEALHVPYSYGFAIILLTVLVKGATFPLTKKQVESTMAMQNLQPKLKEIQQHYAGNQEMIQQETARLYQRAGVNPLAGCLPTLATIPVWIGLYRALSNVANEGLLTEGFFWIPSLAGPTTIAARQNGSGISWLFPFLDGHPPLGWSDTLAYLVLPMLLIMSQYVSMQIMQPPQANDPSQKQSQAILKFLPLMIGYFALSVPSGLSLYWLTNNILSTTQQLWFRKHRNVKPPPLQNLESTKNIIDIQANLPVSPKPKTDVKEPRRGERFKQIMAEEARRKKEREAAATQKIGEQSPMVGNRTDPDHSKNTESGSQSSEANSMGVNGYQHNTVAENKNKIITDSNRQNSETSDEAGPSNHTVESSDLSARK